MKTLKRFSAILLALLLCAAVLAPSAYADGEGGTGASSNYTPVAGTSATFYKYLVLDEKANVPNVTFTYTITAGTAVPASTTDNTFEVLAGITGENVPTVGTAVFSTADTKLTAVATGDTVTLDSGENYVKKSVTIDFRGVSFDEPGVYRYLLTENETNGAMGTTYDTQKSENATAKQRTVDVYVSDNNGTLVVSEYVIHTETAAPKAGTEKGSADVTTAGAALPDKSDGFVNEYETHDLTISKTVEGNQGSKDKYFKFTVAISGAVAGTKYTVALNGATASGSNSATVAANRNQTNPTEITIDSDGTKTVNFYLKHGQSIVIQGLAKGTVYTVTEDAEDYKSSAADGYTGTIDDADVTAAFTNTRNGVVPTGVVMTVIPGIVIVAVAVAGLILLGRKKREA